MTPADLDALATGVSPAFGDGYRDGFFGETDHEHMHTEGRARQKYLDGRECGKRDRAAGALDPVEPLT